MATSASLIVAVLVAVPAAAQDLYRDHVRPLLDKNCITCHGSKAKQAGLDLSTAEGLLRGGDGGKVVVAGDPLASRLYKLVSHLQTPGMPFGGAKLPDADIARIAEWIKAGATTPAETAAARPAEIDHWAFRTPKRPAVPAVKNRTWVRNPVDVFVAAEHEKRGLKPLAEADRRVLLRRVYLDLVGLAPTAQEMREFLADRAPDAYEKVVDRLLASPRYGERWGRHWMDIWRYSDWYGWRKNNQVRYSARHIWRWRDWIIESVNQDKGYDRMILEMLAGDELAPGDPETARATGYVARNWYMFNRNVWLQEAVEYTSMAFLGLTMKCARCHSHKYDPITQLDYYRMRAFFEPHEVRTDRVAGEPDTLKAGLARIYDADASAPTFRFLRGNEMTPDKDNPLAPGIPEFFGKTPEIQPVRLPLDAYYPDSRTFVHQDLVAQAKAEIEKAEAALKKAEGADGVKLAEKALAAAKAALPALEARIAADKAKHADPPDPKAEELAEQAKKVERDANVLKAQANLLRAQRELEGAEQKKDEKKIGEARKQIEEAAAALKAPEEGYTPIGKIYPDSSSGRRLALARWIASRDNPLTARVAINHVWLRHFGKGLVPTVFNFGKSGKPPSHPELLDWLAVELMDRNWSMKPIHRLLVTSSAYRMRSSSREAESSNLAADRDNTYLWRANARRMEAEVVRDSLLHLAGKLDTTMGGPEIDETAGHENFRRSVYFRHAVDLQMDFLKAFDLANPNECFERYESVAPHQALALANSKLSLAMARTLAKQLSQPAEPQFIAAAFETVLGRPPSKSELAESVKFIAEQTQLFSDPSRMKAFSTGPKAAVEPASKPADRARESFVHVLVNHNDFVTVR